MPIDVIAKVKCDMCGREEAVSLAEGMHGGRAFDCDAPHIMGRLDGWELLGDDGYAVNDPKRGGAHTLCHGCAQRFKGQVAANRRAIEDLFQS